MAGDTANVWEYAELKIYADPFCTSCKISSMNKKARSKVPIEPKSPFKWVFMDVIPATSPKSLTNDTNFNNYLLIVDAYSKLPKLYGLENITTEEVLDKLDMFQARFGKIDQFGWWDLERISADAGTKFTSAKFKEECQLRGVRLTLAAPEHQEMNGQVEVTWRTCVQLHTLSWYTLEFHKVIYISL